MKGLQNRTQAQWNRHALPCNLAAEESMLGAMLLSRDAIVACLAGVSGQDIYHPQHRMVYAAISSLHAAGVAVDPTTVDDELRRRGQSEEVGGITELVRLLVATPATSSASRYAAIVADHAVMRRMIEVGDRIMRLGYSLPSDVDAALAEAQTALAEISR